MKKFLISRFIKHGEQFAYIRRYKAELKESTDTFFDDLIKENLFDNDFKVKSNKFYCDGKVMGFAFTLSTSQSLKSSSFPSVTNLMFDEFIIEPRPKKVLSEKRSSCFLKFN